jgi:hypothetical protein
MERSNSFIHRIAGVLSEGFGADPAYDQSQRWNVEFQQVDDEFQPDPSVDQYFTVVYTVLADVKEGSGVVSARGYGDTPGVGPEVQAIQLAQVDDIKDERGGPVHVTDGFVKLFRDHFYNKLDGPDLERAAVEKYENSGY